jgi:cytochrome c oxidase cbb3-type subunit 3
MMANKSDHARIDQPTGTEFVGHEWDGIEELDTPLPRWWLWTLYLTIIWGIAYIILYPAWPLLEKGTEGLLGWSSRGQLAEEMSAAELARADGLALLAQIPTERLGEDAAALQMAVAGGAAAFKVNCVQCHGSGAGGSQTLGYPNLADDDWLWGGDLKAIEYTLAHGIRQQGEDKTRSSTMPPFEGAFDAAQVDALVNHVLSLSGASPTSEVGTQLYADNCLSCHGATGEGDRLLGAPRLNDAIWLRGNSREAIAQQILNPRMGMMPKWEGRLDPVTIKMLAAYVHSLGGGEDTVEVVADPATKADEQS